jgi:Bacterial PH domain
MTSPKNDRPTSPATAGAGQPEYADRAYRSMTGICGGVLLLVLAAWLGGDAIVRGNGHTPWLALAVLLLCVPLIIGFTIRPAVFANDERVRIRNPFRTVTLPWSGVDSVRASYSTELFAGDRKFQLWAIPVSLRARKRAARQTARAKVAAGEGRRDPFTPAPRRRPTAADPDGTVRSWSDQALEELRELAERDAVDETARPPAVVRWAYEVIAPAVAGAVVLAVLLGIGG